jgi:excisionase family DNA binding protein
MTSLVQPKTARAAQGKQPSGLRFALADLADSLAVGVSSAIVKKAKSRAASADVIRQTVKDLMPSLLEGEFSRRLMDNGRGARKQRAVLIHLLSSADMGNIPSGALAADSGKSGDEDILTSEQAAELLHVSRTHVNALMDSGALGPVMRTSGRHRRVPKAAVLAYKEQSKKRQARGLEAMARASQRLGLYDEELEGIPRRSKR